MWPARWFSSRRGIFCKFLSGDPKYLLAENVRWLAGAGTSLPLRHSENGEVVWEKSGYWTNLKNNFAPYIEVMVSEHPALQVTE